MRKISFSPPDISELEIEEVAGVLRSGWITTGPKTKEFERKIAGYCGTEHAVCLNSATSCLELTLRMLGVGPGDEVIVPAYTYTATAAVVAHVGATIVMVDSGKDSFEMDYDLVEKAVTERTKVIIPVDFAGMACDYDRVYEIVERKRHLFRAHSRLQEVFGRIIVVADAAHSFGAERRGLRTGAMADFSAFSFHAVKILTTGEGGALTWRSHPGLESGKLYRRLQLMSLHGQSKDALAKCDEGGWEYDIVAPYYKCNMTDIVAALGLIQFGRYPENMKKRLNIADIYDRALKELPVVTFNRRSEETKPGCHLYPVLLDGFDEQRRDKLIKKMGEAGIATNVHYKPLPMMTAYRSLGFDIKDYPHARDLYRREITLPLHTRMNGDDAQYVVQNFSKLVKDLNKG